MYSTHVGHTHCYITLTEEQDAELALLERTAGINPKCSSEPASSWPLQQHLTGLGRIRLSSKRHPIAWLVAHFKCSRSTIEADLDRFDQHGIEGLVDGKAPGQPAKVTAEMIVFLETKLTEDQVWNCTLLTQEIQTRFGADIKRDTIRVKLLELGYS